MEEKRKLHILWTTADAHTSHFMVMMYATNSMLRGWWEEVTVIVWGATAKYVAEDKDIQERMKLAEQAGVKFSACVACAVQLGVKDTLEGMGVEVIPWGALLTELIENKKPLITI